MVPIFIGIVPVSLFHAKSRTVRLVRRVSEPGSRPERLLWSSLSEMRRLSPPIASGIVPAVIVKHQYMLRLLTHRVRGDATSQMWVKVDATKEEKVCSTPLLVCLFLHQ